MASLFLITFLEGEVDVQNQSDHAGYPKGKDIGYEVVYVALPVWDEVLYDS